MVLNAVDGGGSAHSGKSSAGAMSESEKSPFASIFGFPGVSNCFSGGGAVAALVFSSGLVRTARRARFSFCAERSALRAEAVLAATEGVTWRACRDGDPSRRGSRDEATRERVWLWSSLAIREARESTSVDSWSSARSMLRNVRLIVSKDGALRKTRS